MKTTTRLVSDFVYEAENENKNKVNIDMRAAEDKSGQSPTELLLSALAACASVDLVQMLKKRKKTVNDLQVITEGERRAEHPRGFTHIQMHFFLDSPDVKMAEFEKMAHLAATSYCSVAASISAEISHTFEIINSQPQ